MTNSITVITPYWHNGTWVFDDAEIGLRQEPFILYIPDMITEMVKDIPRARQGFRMLFSSSPFPGYQVEMEWVKKEYGGHWYRPKGRTLEGWLCPALFHYFRETPRSIFVKTEPLIQ